MDARQAAQRSWILPSPQLGLLLDAIRQEGYELIGPAVRDAAIVFDAIERAEDLPIGLSVEQRPGSYRITRAENSDERFAYACGPTSLKRFLYPPKLPLWEASRTAGGLQFRSSEPETPRYAFVGVRSCDLKSIEILDKVLLGSTYQDIDYKQRRSDALFVAVSCVHTGAACFCSSMDAGPSPKDGAGFDLLLTEQRGDETVFYLVEPGSERGERILESLTLEPANADQVLHAKTQLEAASSQQRKIDSSATREALKRSLESPRWDEIASRCLACANCTLVCPTCFCFSVEDHTNLTGDVATRSRHWDSCFHQSFSYVAGGSIRATIKGRYRQWLTHKLSSWVDQFGALGCVGCGRCIVWCPVGIDIVAEANGFVTDSASVPNANQSNETPTVSKGAIS